MQPLTSSNRIQIGLLAALVIALLAAACNDLSRSPSPTPSTLPTTTLQPSPTPLATSTPPAQAPDASATPQREPASPTPEATATVSPTPPPPASFDLPDVARVVRQARPAVVSVVSEVVQRDMFGRRFLDTQSGSGVIFDSAGYILTNNHVVEQAQVVTVTLDDSRQYEAEVVGTDSLTDLAVLKIEGDNLRAVPLAGPSALNVGDWVVAIGNALALPGGPTVTVGVVSALDRDLQTSTGPRLYGLIQTDASINPGNSGGPLLNLRGEVVGINTAVARGDTSGRLVEGIGFAVGMDTATPVAQQLVEEGRVRWAYLGVTLRELDAELAAQLGLPVRKGVLIEDIVPEFPAWEAGLRPGDVVVAIGGIPVPTVRDLIRLLRFEFGVGDRVEVSIFRDDEELTRDVTLGERPPL